MKRRKRFRRIKAVLIATILVCLLRIGQIYHQVSQVEEKQKNLKESLSAEEKPVIAPAAKALIPELPEKAPAAADPAMLKRYENIYRENNDLVGWLSIEGTNIDYPVVRCDDGEYYLHHDFYGNEDKYGCLFVRDIADVDTPATNFVIYGHNMKDGAMFGDLDLYSDESFYREHTDIMFNTLYEERSYEIISVFRSEVYESDDDVFKYYQFYEADTQEEFDYFYRNIKEMSMYDTKVTAEFGDTFITLSTCAYHTDDGRFVIVAKRKK